MVNIVPRYQFIPFRFLAIFTFMIIKVLGISPSIVSEFNDLASCYVNDYLNWTYLSLGLNSGAKLTTSEIGFFFAYWLKDLILWIKLDPLSTWSLYETNSFLKFGFFFFSKGTLNANFLLSFSMVWVFSNSFLLRLAISCFPTSSSLPPFSFYSCCSGFAWTLGGPQELISKKSYMFPRLATCSQFWVILSRLNKPWSLTVTIFSECAYFSSMSSFSFPVNFFGYCFSRTLCLTFASNWSLSALSA